MLNFLPEEERKRIKGVYRTQLAVIALVFLFVTISIATAFLIPSNILMKTRADVVRERTENITQSLTENGEATPEAQITDIRLKMNALRVMSITKYPSDLLQDILSARPEEVTFNRISYSFKDLSQSFQITGNSRTRSALLSFENTLKGVEWVSAAVVPIQYLAKEVDIDFSMTIQGDSPEE